MYGSGAGNIHGTGSEPGAGGGKIKWVDTIAQRDALITVGAVADLDIVRVRDAYVDDDSVVEGWAEYTYHIDQTPALWEKTGEQEGFDEKYQPSVDDSLTTTQKYGNIPSGTLASYLRGLPINRILDDMFFQTVPFVYTAPTAGLTNVSGTVEVGQVFNVAINTSYNPNDGGNPNRVRIRVNGTDVQDTALPDALNYNFSENDIVLGDGVQRTYQSIIHYDEGPVRQNNKGADQPGNIQAGSVGSAVRTIVGRRLIFAQMSVAIPSNSNEVRNLSVVQYDNSYTMQLPVQNGDTSITLALPANRNLSSAIYQSTLGINADHTSELLDSLSIIAVEGASPGYTQNYRLMRLQPPASYTSGTYVLTFTAI